jgi:hypothetical protein
MAHTLTDDKRPPGADGVPPGAEAQRKPADKHAFDADGRAAAREDAPVTIGGETWHRRRKNWEVTRALRTLLRRQERAGIRQDRARKKIDALPPDEESDAQIDSLEAEIDDATDASDEAAYELIALLLRSDDDEQRHPDVDFLKASLDVEDAGDLAATLAGGGEPDPTTDTPS